MDNGIDRLLNKRVLVVKTDNFKKFGTLVSTDASVLGLRFSDGTIEYIPWANISSVKEENGNGVRR